MPQPPKQIIGLSELKALRRDMAGVSMTPFLDHITKRLKRRIDPRVRVFRNPEAHLEDKNILPMGPNSTRANIWRDCLSNANGETAGTITQRIIAGKRAGRDYNGCGKNGDDIIIAWFRGYVRLEEG